jgi:hypothetical protein
MVRVAGWSVAAAALAAWAYGVYLLIAGDTRSGLVIAGVAAVVMLLLAWARGVFWLPDGGGP